MSRVGPLTARNYPIAGLMTDPNHRTEKFLSLYNREQRRLFAMIRSLLFTREDAEEVFQETCIALWRSFDQFEPGTDFSAWSSAIARNRVLAFRKKCVRQPAQFSDEIFSQLTDDYVDHRDQFERRHHALLSCMEGLKVKDRDLLRRRYETEVTTVELAEQLGQPLNTLYKRLQRIRKQLLACVQRTLAAEERASEGAES